MARLGAAASLGPPPRGFGWPWAAAWPTGSSPRLCWMAMLISSSSLRLLYRLYSSLPIVCRWVFAAVVAILGLLFFFCCPAKGNCGDRNMENERNSNVSFLVHLCLLSGLTNKSFRNPSPGRGHYQSNLHLN